MIRDLYAPSLALLTDLYQLTMGFGYWRNGIHDRRAAFHLFFRSSPFGGQFAIAAGLATAVDWIEGFRVEPDDVDFLRTLQGNDARPLFPNEFLDAIAGLRLTVDVDAMPEGTVAMPHQPLVRVVGPLWQCQWIESALLNVINFQTLIATKAARVDVAARGESVLEFGLRRAQGIDGSISATRAAYIGGCAATSNVLAGKILGIPVRGTHAHSWVMSFDDELASFEAYADAMPNNCLFLVDTYDTIEGVRNAIRVGQELKGRGHALVGVRLDSGDLAELSIAARRLLDEAGFTDAVIVASNDLDEYLITELKRRGATIAVWGVGTRLVTGGNQPALGGVYKLGAIADEQGNWQPRIKLSELPIKTSTPGIQQVRRYRRGGTLVGDLIYSELIGPPNSAVGESFAGDSLDFGSLDELSYEDLLVPVMREGRLVAEMPSLPQIRARTLQQRSMLPAAVQSIEGPQPYPAGLESRLADQKRQLISLAE